MSSLRTLLAAAAAAVAVSLPAVAHADAPETHDGFYLRLALGLGYLSDSGSAKLTSANTFDYTLKGGGIATELLFGGTVIPGLVVGGGFQGGSFPKPKIKSGSVEREFDATATISSVGPFVDYYFNPRGGLHLQGFVGLGVISARDDNNRTTSNNPTGLALSVGIGHDWFVSEQWSIGVLGRLQYMNLTATDSGIEDKHSIISPALLATFTYH